MEDHRNCVSENSYEDARERAAEFESALRALFETLGTATEGGRRIVGIPNLDKFWNAYDAAERIL